MKKIECSKISLLTFKASLVLETVYSSQTLSIVFVSSSSPSFSSFFLLIACGKYILRIKLQLLQLYIMLRCKVNMFTLAYFGTTIDRIPSWNSLFCLLTKLFSGGHY